MRENRTYGSEGGESGSTGLPYPYLSIGLGTKPRDMKTNHVPFGYLNVRFSIVPEKWFGVV